MRDMGPATFLDLEQRPAKPRSRGITAVIDGGLPVEDVDAVLATNAGFIDLWKLGWGSSYLDPRLAAKLEGGDTVVDAEGAGKMLGVTPRTARRLLRTLVDEGLAWPLPPNRTPQPGRPRQLYRLIVEKLGPR